jgi:hypothetical protein
MFRISEHRPVANGRCSRLGVFLIGDPRTSPQRRLASPTAGKAAKDGSGAVPFIRLMQCTIDSANG